MPVIRNPYLGQTVDPYGGAEWIDLNRSIPDISRHTLGPDQVVVEPRGANAHVTYHQSGIPPTDPSVSVVSMHQPLGADNHLTQFSQPPREHSMAQTVVGVAALAGAAYVINAAADAYIGNSRERYLRWMWVWTAIYCVFLIFPFVAMALFVDPSLLIFATPFAIILGLGWGAVPGRMRQLFPEPLPPPVLALPPPSIQATYDRP